MIKSFKQFNEQREKEVYFTFGRFNPPTTGHQKLLDKIAAAAKGKDYKIYASSSNDRKKNPLEYKEKVRFMRKIFPKHARNIMLNQRVNNVLAIASDLYDAGYNKITMVVGADRVKDFEKLLKQYDNVKSKHGYYNFVHGINVISAGDRDPDAEDVTGMSASKMRAAAIDGNFKLFQTGLPKGYSGGVELFNTLRKRMGLKEMSDFREHVQLEKISDIREAYARGEIFNIGDRVYNKQNRVVTIAERKPNYIVSKYGKKYWITDLSEVRKVAQDKDIGDRKGAQPKVYHKGLSKSTKIKRDAQFKKQAKMKDDDPKAYKPAPGDARAKTKPSKHTLKYKQMFGEDLDPITEALITFANRTYPKSGHMVILAGGAGSGKGFVLDNLLGIEGKVFDVDELKRLAIKTPKISQRIEKEFGTDITQLNLKSPEDVSTLHQIIGDELNLPHKRQATFFANVLAQKPNTKPNVIFDVTLKDLRKLQNITRIARTMGYDSKNVHIVWVINDIEVAKKQNLDPKRGRVVPVEILVNTHRGASQTMIDIMNMGKGLKKYMDGDIVFAFNKINVDSDLQKSKAGGAFIQKSNYFYAKRSGKQVIPHRKLSDEILTKIAGYVPNANTWIVGESVQSFKQFTEKTECPAATQSVELNTKNRNSTIKNHMYGPLNVDEPGDYWEKIADKWDTTVDAAKKSLCGNCVAFDISPRMKDCMPGKTSDGEGVLGYCWMHHFKCHSARTCDTWAKGGPITKNDISNDWQERAFGKNEGLDYPSDELTKQYKKDTPGYQSEILDPRKHDVGDYIDDFMKSDAPQFKGKSKEKIRAMALAAYRAARKDAGLEEGTGKYKGETWKQGYERRVVKTTDPEHKAKGYNWRIKGKERDNISIKLYKEKPSYDEYTKQMKRVAGHEFGK